MVISQLGSQLQSQVLLIFDTPVRMMTLTREASGRGLKVEVIVLSKINDIKGIFGLQSVRRQGGPNWNRLGGSLWGHFPEVSYKHRV